MVGHIINAYFWMTGNVLIELIMENGHSISCSNN